MTGSLKADHAEDLKQNDGKKQKGSIGVAFQILMGRWLNHTTYAVVRLGVFDKLSLTEPKNADEVASQLGLNSKLLYRLLRLLGSTGLLDEDDDFKFTLNEEGAIFCEDHPMSLKKFLLLEEGDEHYAIWRHLPDIILKYHNKSGFELEYGKPWTEYLAATPKYADVFHSAMTSFSVLESQSIAWTINEANLLRSVKSVCDIGGGEGHLLNAVLDQVADPGIKGYVLEIPSLVDSFASGENYDKVKDKIEFIPGDMFSDVVSADVYLLKYVLHDWPDEECIEILRTARRNANEDTKIIVCELLITQPGVFELPKFADIHTC